MALARSGLWLLPVLVLLQACGSTPFGQQLSESFDAPSSVPINAPQGRQAKTAVRKPVQAPSTQATTTQDKPSTQRKPVVPSPQDAVKSPVRRQAPQPYRITIRLSAADPSAPAEVVTRSLREAGIGFEVETIERIQPPGTLRVTPEQRGANP